MSSRVENPIKGRVSTWHAPQVRPGIESEPPVPNAEQIQAILDQARAEGYAAGHREGLAAGQGEIAAQVARFSDLCCAMSEPFAEIDAAAEQQLVNLAAILAEQVLREELRTHPELLAKVVRQSCVLLKSSVTELTVYLHPDDLILLENHAAGSGLPGRFIARGDLKPGDVLVDSEEQFIDARVHSLVSALLEAMNTKPRGESVDGGGDEPR